MLDHFLALLLLVGAVVDWYESAWDQIVDFLDFLFQVFDDLDFTVQNVFILME
jgi:hypothetical protein